LTSIEQPNNQPVIAVTNLSDTAPAYWEGVVPYARDNLGEDAYTAPRGGPVDPHINDDQVHGDSYDVSAFTPAPLADTDGFYGDEGNLRPTYGV